MPVLQVLVILVVLFVVGAVAAGRGDRIPDAPEDRPDLSLPAERRIGRDDVEGVRFSLALRGYRMDEVDAVLDRLAAEIAARDERIAALESRVAADEPTAPADPGPAA